MNTHWHIIEVTGGKVLTAHDVLTELGIPCLAFVEINRRTPLGRIKEKRGKREAVAVSCFSRYLFADLSAIESLYLFSGIMAQKDYIYGAMGKGERFYVVNDAEFDALRDLRHETGRYKGKRKHQEYERHKHSRYNLNKVYGQTVVKPEFDRGDLVSFAEGGFRGLIYEVQGVDKEGNILMRGNEKLFGGVDLIKCENPFALEKVV